ncbi:helix-turn-helix domain-containing protein [Methylobacterium platani]|uniref:helix-turn-helix domain-containing protein n=1 Tax=Methylobacterium platani TaxID=427683 RepID=UPI0009E43B5D|nr:AraC family transcriptional regulator [Methylobacterium platani]
MNTDFDGLSVECRRYDASVAEHRHDYHQIVLSNCGKMEIEIEGCSGMIDQGQGAFIASSDRHEFCCVDGGMFLVLDISDGQSIGLCHDPDAFGHLTDRKFFRVDDKIRHLASYASAKTMNKDQSLARKAWATLIISELVDFSKSQLSMKARSIHRALEYIDANFSRKIAVSAIAKETGVSERSLHSLFVDHLNTTPHSYIVAKRIEYAMLLLKTTQKTAPEIASLSGYADQSALSRSMQKHHGVTPAQYRQLTRRTD